jgi:hypothetical protein
MTKFMPMPTDSDSKSALAQQLSGSSDRIGRHIGRIGGAATALLFVMAAAIPINSGALAPGIEQVENKR